MPSVRENQCDESEIARLVADRLGPTNTGVVRVGKGQYLAIGVNHNIIATCQTKEEAALTLGDYRMRRALDIWNERMDRLLSWKGGDAYEGWESLAQLIWTRDNGICWVCREKVEPGQYELGHLVDRCIGGTATPDNLVVMCATCNHFKPLHRTLAEFLEYAGLPPDHVVNKLNDGGWERGSGPTTYIRGHRGIPFLRELDQVFRRAIAACQL